MGYGGGSSGFGCGGGIPAFSGVVAPAPTSQSVPAGGSLSPKLFGAFTDPNGLIDPSNYSLVTTTADGTCSWSGSGLGAYTPTDADGDSGTLSLQARDSSGNVLATAIHSYDRAASAGGGAGVLVDELDLDLKTVTSAGPFTSGLNNFTIGAVTLPIRTTEFASNNGSIEAVNGTGFRIVGANASTSTITHAADFTGLLANTWDTTALRTYDYYIHYVIESLDITKNTSDGFFIGVSQNTTHNSGDSRVLHVDRTSTATDERRRVRNQTSNSPDIDTRTIQTSRVITMCISNGEIVAVLDTAGTTPPTAPDKGAAYMIGGDAVGLLDSAAAYATLYGILSATQQGSYTWTRLLVQRLEAP